VWRRKDFRFQISDSRFLIYFDGRIQQMTRVAHIQPFATGGKPPEVGHIPHSQILQRSVFGACLGESGAFDEIQCSVFIPLQRSVFGACLGESGAFDEIQCSVFSHPHQSDPEPNWYIYHSDHLGSSAFLTDAAGDPTQHLQYMPFGESFIEQRSITSYYTPYTFSAKERDTETGYSYFGARYYDADISVWLSVDPMSDKGPGVSPYSYSFNRPVVFVDPDGEWPFPPSIQSAGFVFRSIWNARLWIKHNVIKNEGPIQVRLSGGRKADLDNPVRNNNKLQTHCSPIRENYANFDNGSNGDVNTRSSQNNRTESGSGSISVYVGNTSNEYPFTGISRDGNGQPISIPILEEFSDGTVTFRPEFRNANGLAHNARPVLNATGDVTVRGSGQVVYRRPSGLNVGDSVEDHGGQIVVTRNAAGNQIDVTQQVLNSLP